MAGAQTAWGIDVGVSALKAIKLRRDGERVSVEAFDIIEHDRFLTESDVDRDTMIRSTLQKFLNKYNLRRETVYIGVPGSMAFARFVKLPPVEHKKIPEIVRFEAIQQIPFPLDQVNWDYHTFQHPDSPDVEVGIFAMKKELVAQVLSNFQAVEMSVQGVQMSPLAVYNAAAFDGMTADKGTVLIDMGAEHTDLVVMDQGRLWLRTINIGGNHFTDALAKSFKQSFSKAESLKKQAATSKYQKQIYQAMRPIFADMVAEIQRSIGHYNSSHRDSRLERVVCMGNPFKLPNLQKYLQQELKMEVIRLESYQRANVEKAAAFAEDILAMTAAYGLAIQALGMAPINSNLLPVEIARKMMWRQKQPWFVAAALLVAVGAAAIVGQWWMASSAYAGQEITRETNARDMSEVQAQMGKWQQIPDSEAEEAKTKIDNAMKLADTRGLWPELTLDIYGALPQAMRRPELVVINKISSDYTGALSQVPAGGAVGQGGTGAPPPQLAPGESDHGFVITMLGYTPSQGKYKGEVVTNYSKALLARAPLTKNPAGEVVPVKDPITGKDKPYYFTDAIATGQQVLPGRGGLGGGSPGGTYALPWGTAGHGPYWDIFTPEITQIKPQQPGTPGPGAFGSSPFGGVNPDQPAGGPVGELPYPVDLVSPKTPQGARPLTNAYQFKLVFKVHVR